MSAGQVWVNETPANVKCDGVEVSGSEDGGVCAARVRRRQILSNYTSPKNIWQGVAEGRLWKRRASSGPDELL